MPVIELEKVCTIDTSIDEAWEALTDISAYGDWNPFVVAAEASGLPAGKVLLAELALADGEQDEAVGLLTGVRETPGPVGDAADGYLTLLEDPDPRLRYPCAWSGPELTAGRSRVSDEEWVALGAAPDDEAYYDEFERLFGLDLRTRD